MDNKIIERETDTSAAPLDQSEVLHCAPWWRMVPYWLRLKPGVTMDCGTYVAHDAHLSGDTTPTCPECEQRATGPISENNCWPIRQRWSVFS